MKNFFTILNLIFFVIKTKNIKLIKQLEMEKIYE